MVMVLQKKFLVQSRNFHGFVATSTFCQNRPVSNLVILYSLQLTQEKEKSSLAQCSTGPFKKFFLVCENKETCFTLLVSCLCNLSDAHIYLCVTLSI